MTELLDYHLRPLRDAVDEALERYLPTASDIAQPLVDAMRYSLAAGGKRVRPMLCLAAAEALGGRRDDALMPACAIEYAHTYSLIHDDLPAMDDDDLRRGRPTCHVVFGEANAILAGNGLLTLAMAMMAEAPGLSAATRLANVSALGTAIGWQGMLAGQYLDLAAEGHDLPLAQLEALHDAKTGALIAASLHIGAQCAGASDDDQTRLAAYGRKLGLAFQVMDDILDITADTATLGKPAGSDLAADKNTYPRKLGLAGAREKAASLSHEAMALLEPLGTNAASLRAITTYLLHREY